MAMVMAPRAAHRPYPPGTPGALSPSPAEPVWKVRCLAKLQPDVEGTAFKSVVRAALAASQAGSSCEIAALKLQAVICMPYRIMSSQAASMPGHRAVGAFVHQSAKPLSSQALR